MLYKTRFCPRMFRDVPFVGHVGEFVDERRRHWCIDCWLIQRRRALARWWRDLGRRTV